jgi:hypothetical protein
MSMVTDTQRIKRTDPAGPRSATSASSSGSSATTTDLWEGERTAERLCDMEEAARRTDRPALRAGPSATGADGATRPRSTGSSRRADRLRRWRRRRWTRSASGMGLRFRSSPACLRGHQSLPGSPGIPRWNTARPGRVLRSTLGERGKPISRTAVTGTTCVARGVHHMGIPEGFRTGLSLHARELAWARTLARLPRTRLPTSSARRSPGVARRRDHPVE